MFTKEQNKSKEVIKICDYFNIDEAFNKVSTANEDDILENCTIIMCFLAERRFPKKICNKIFNFNLTGLIFKAKMRIMKNKRGYYASNSEGLD